MKTTNSALNISDKIRGAALAAPSSLIIVIFFIYPFFNSFIGSFYDRAGKFAPENYQFALERYGQDLVYTVVISIISVILLLLITAFLAGIFRLYTYPVIEFLFKVPLFVPYVVVGHAVRVYLAPHGTLNSLLAFLGLLNPDNMPSIAYSSLGLIFALVWKNLGMSLLIILGAYRGISDATLEAARQLGAGRLRIIKDFLIPMSKGAFGVVAILMFTSMISSFSIPSMIGSGQKRMIMLDIHQQMIIQQNPGVANALGVFTYILSIGAAFYYLRGIKDSD